MERSRASSRVPGVVELAGAFSRLKGLRAGRVPIGLLALVPVALFIDLFDVTDELVLGPVGMGLSFVIESAFLLAITGRPVRAFGFAGIDLLPLVDTIPFATIALVREIVRAWGSPPEDDPATAYPPVIDI